MLQNYFQTQLLEAGCDEAGRGCLAGSLFGAAVILPPDYSNATLNDSKKLTPKKREMLRLEIEREALAWCVVERSAQRIDEINVLRAAHEAMSLAVKGLSTTPELILVDGNLFFTDLQIPYECIIKGDGKFANIAAASILAKTHRDEYMRNLDKIHPEYKWQKNKGYPTKDHKQAIEKYGITQYHRLSFRM